MPGFVDGKVMKLSDIDLEFIATNANGKKCKQNPERCLVRHNWMEIFVRLASTRYIKFLKETTSPFEASTKLFNDYLIPYWKKFSASYWRRKMLHREEVDLSLKHSLPTLKKVYQKFSGKYASPGAPKYMSLDEF